MSLEPIKIWELVDRAVLHRWSIPEFQRGFVWKATQVRDLAESLWLDYPVGSLLVWNSEQPQETKVAKDGVGPSQWIVDGQQRTTALAILFGRKPYWWSSADDWNKTLKRYDIRFDIAAKDAPYFLVANAAIRKANARELGDAQRRRCQLPQSPAGSRSPALSLCVGQSAQARPVTVLRRLPKETEDGPLGR